MYKLYKVYKTVNTEFHLDWACDSGGILGGSVWHLSAGL